jgi:protein disulfide-isomerase A1
VVGDDDDDHYPESVPAGASDVIILTDDTFDDLTAHGTWLIEFFAPWCGHCKKLKPTWEKVATELSGKMSLATVDCTSEKKLAERFEVKSFPTLKLWRDGASRMYKGDRSEEALIKFGLDLLKPAVTEVDSGKAIKEAATGTPVSFLLVEGSDAKLADAATKVFERIAYKMQGLHKFLRAKGDDGKLAKKFSVTSQSAVVVIMEGGDDEKYTGGWSEATLTAWIEKRKLPLLSELDATNFEDVTQAGKIVIFSATDPSSSMTRSYLKEMLNVAKRYRDFVFANIDGVKFNKYVSQFGVTTDLLPTLFALDYPKDEYYVGEDLSRFMNENQISRFADDILSGRIPPRGTSAWYSPMRYYKMFEKWVSTFTEAQLGIAVTIAILTFLLLIGAACYYGLQDFGPDPAPKKASGSGTAAATAADNKKKT